MVHPTIGWLDKRLLATSILWMAVYLLLALPKIHQPVTDDEIYEIRNAERIVAGEPIDLFVPPVYDYMLAGALSVFGPNPWTFRLPGVLSSLVAIYIVSLFGFRLGSEREFRTPFLAGLLLALHPAFVQGSLLVHIDNTVLVPTILLWLFFLREYCAARRSSYLVAAGTFLTTALFIKFSTPILVIPATVLYVFMKRNRRMLSRYVLTVALSLTVFAGGWALFAAATGLDFLKPFSDVSGRVGLYWAALSGGWGAIVSNSLSLSAWFTPYLLIGALLPVKILLTRESWRHNTLPLIYAASISILLYFFISTFNHGFPKYVMPSLPLLILLVAHHAFGDMKPAGRTWIPYLVGSAALCVCFIAIGFDPVYDFRYSLRAVVAEGGGISESARAVLSTVFIWLLPLVVCLWIALKPLHRGERRGVSFPLLITSLLFSHSLSLSIRQATRPYQTNYSYGERGTAEVEEYVQSHIETTDRVLATKDILYRIERKDEYLGMDVWRDIEKFSHLLRDSRSKFLVISIPSHSVTAYRSVFRSPDIQRYLNTFFDKRSIGTYEVYERKERDGHGSSR